MGRIDEYDYCVLCLVREGTETAGKGLDGLLAQLGIDAWGNDWHGFDLEDDEAIQVILA